MAVRLKEPRQTINVAATAALLLVGLVTAPVLAAPDRALICYDAQQANLDIGAAELTATPVSNSDELLESHLLKPRAKSAARGAFAEQAETNDAEDPNTEVAEEGAASEPGIHSASDRKLMPLKRQMYRRDI